LVPRRPTLALRRERWDTPDADYIDVDWLDSAAADAPLLVVFHGLEGSSKSHYATALMAQANQLGWHGVVPHFRGCGGTINRAPRFYHSGDSTEVDWILRSIHARLTGAPLYAVGVSLGGNVLLKWLGERGTAASGTLRAAVAISAPVDLAASGAALSAGFNRIYAQYFLRSLKPKCLVKLEQYPGLFNREAMLRSRDLYEFDNVVTAPLHGFRDTNDYWQQASSKPLLGGIRVPTLLLNARNDPFLPEVALPRDDAVSTHVVADFTDEGGHVGYPGTWGSESWLARRVTRFLVEGH